ncbi:hypothetical protein VPBG_00042 [Vibrio phage helene 12B3]|uniref:endonuclease n=1 Tax=Vibrio phage helene 12B3 TaxID=573173 RepID=UPI0002C0E2C2|nr:endonuclease [Vibrio phage helene 12B3]AGG57814.1 hypothetical protein VPBG_00042 [Vibrio phage helene 12B3]
MTIPESEWTKGQREFVGSTFEVEKTGAILTVTGVSGKSGMIALFSVECSICSKDVELFPEGISSSKGSLSRGKIPCGCSSIGKKGKDGLTHSQRDFIGTQFITEKGSILTVTGVSGKIGSNDLFSVECSVCSEDTELFPDGFSRVKGMLQNKDGSLKAIPCGCSNSPKWTDRQDEILTQRLLDKTQPNLKVIGSVKVKGKDRKFILECNVCSSDDELWPLGSITSTKDSLGKGVVPCGCSKNPNYSESQWKIKVQRECNQSGYVFHGFDLSQSGGKFKGQNTKLDLSNPTTGNRWQSTSITGFLNKGSGDPSDARYGYNPTLDGRLYLIEWFGFGESYLKKGITNKETLTRIKQQYRKSKLDYRIIREIHSEDGELIADLEKFLNTRFDGSQCSKELLPDGYTETVENTPEVYQELNSWFDKFEKVVSGELKLEDVIKEEA